MQGQRTKDLCELKISSLGTYPVSFDIYVSDFFVLAGKGSVFVKRR